MNFTKATMPVSDSSGRRIEYQVREEKRPLYEQLEENRERLEEEFSESIKFKEKKLDTFEADHLNRNLLESRRRIEEEKQTESNAMKKYYESVIMEKTEIPEKLKFASMVKDSTDLGQDKKASVDGRLFVKPKAKKNEGDLLDSLVVLGKRPRKKKRKKKKKKGGKKRAEKRKFDNSTISKDEEERKKRQKLEQKDGE